MDTEKQDLAWRYLMTIELDILFSRKNFHQFYRYALAGILTNILGYVAYIFLTYLWGAPKVTMTTLYLVGVLTTFFINRRFTFLHDGNIGATGVRYLLVQVLGYLLNLFLLVIFVDWLGLPHQIVQATAMLVVAIFLFSMLRIFVFIPNNTKSKVIP